MTTRTLADLIDEVRFSTNNTDTVRYTDDRLIKFFNSAQRYVQKVVYNSNPSGGVFTTEQVLAIVPNQSEYDLPTDLYAMSAINDITPLNAGGSFVKPLRLITIKERDKEYGYFITNSKLHFSPQNLINSYSGMVITYTKILEDATVVTDEYELPPSCEEYLMLYVERKINYTASSADTKASLIFSEDERDQLIKLFKQNSKDIKYPVISDETYFNY